MKTYVSPERFGIASENILRMLKGCEEHVHYLYTFSLSCNGVSICEAQRVPFDRKKKMNCLSIGKSLVSMAIGILETERRLSLDDLLLDYFEDLLPENHDERIRGLRLRHLLTMAAGSTARSTPFVTLEEGRDWGEFYLSCPLPNEPGTEFEYDTGASYMLSRLVTKLTGKSTLEFLKEKVFCHMDITDIAWLSDPDGVSVGGWGLYMTPADMDKLGRLWADYGSWNGKQLVPRDWLRRATGYQIDTQKNPGLGWKNGYGYQFWVGEYGTFLAFGGFGQLIICQPATKMVAVVTAGCSFEETQWMGDFIHETIFGAMKNEPLPENKKEYEKLSFWIENWKYPYPEGEKDRGVYAGKYEFESNPFAIQYLELKKPEDCTLKFILGQDGNAYDLSAGYRSWNVHTAGLAPWPDEEHGFSYAWEDEDTLCLTQCMTNSPYVRYYRLKFRDNGVDLSIGQNFSLVSGREGIMKGEKS